MHDTAEESILFQFAELEVRKRALEKELKEVTDKMSSLERPAMDFMAENQIDKIALHGLTFSPRRRIYAAPAEGYTKGDVANALIASGLGDYVSNDYNSNSLSGYVASFARESDEVLTPADIRDQLPEQLKVCVTVGEVWKLGATQSGTKKAARPAAK